MNGRTKEDGENVKKKELLIWSEKEKNINMREKRKGRKKEGRKEGKKGGRERGRKGGDEYQMIGISLFLPGPHNYNH